MRKNADTLLVATVLFVGALGSGLAWYRQCLRAPMVLAASPGYLAAEQAEETIYQIYRRTYRTYSRTSGEPIDEGTLHLYGAVTCGITSFVYLFVLAAPFFFRHAHFCQPWRTWQVLFLCGAVLANLLCVLALALAMFPKQS